MRKRIFSVFLAVAMIFCLIPLSAHAEHQHTFENKHGYDLTNLPEGYSIPCKIYESPCSSECGYSLYSWDVFGLSGQFVDKSGTSGLVVYQHYREWFEKIYGKNASAKQFTPGGGSADGSSGVGRSDLGYTEDNKPLVSHDGSLVVMAEPYGVSYYFGDGFTTSVPAMAALASNGTGGGTTYPGSTNLRAAYRFTAPVTGLYYVGSGGSPYNLGFCDFAYGDSWKRIDFTFSYTSALQYKITLSKGDVAYLLLPRTFANAKNAAFKFSMKNCPIFVDILSDSNINNYNKYTINNNTWNGNIYQDNSTNLTYIYPQYTTINENNETVTNISNNPIIYNNETKQYYTYDTVTNNYYYITYEAPTPSPSPDPEPTPTPEPGGNTGDTSGIMKILQEIKAVLVSGFAGITGKLDDISTPETAKPGSSSGNKGQSWWEKLLGKIGDAIVDGLLGAISAVLKLIFKLFTTILGWIIWLVSQVLTLFPFLPPGLGALLIGGVVVCFIIGLIKFIRG